jgi:integrase
VISLLALNGLRVSEATGADIEHLGLERGHRTLTITRAARLKPMGAEGFVRRRARATRFIGCRCLRLRGNNTAHA